MYCKQCRTRLAEGATLCPACGTLNTNVKMIAQPSAAYGPYNYEEPSFYESSYSAKPKAPDEPSLSQNSGNFSTPIFSGYPPTYNAVPLYRAGAVNLPASNGITVTNKSDSGLIVELIFSLFGIFGIGWLIAGDMTVGIILLISSVLIYWPIIILGTILTFGIGLLCLGPLAIGTIILNTLLLNRYLHRKATKFMVVQQPQIPIPPHPPQ